MTTTREQALRVADEAADHLGQPITVADEAAIVPFPDRPDASVFEADMTRYSASARHANGIVSERAVFVPNELIRTGAVNPWALALCLAGAHSVDNVVR